MLWICLYLPDLPIQIVERSVFVKRPIVVSEGPQNRPLVYRGNRLAVDLGIHDGMPVAAANVLALDLYIVARDTRKETDALEQIACWASQFTPSIAIQSPDALLLEVESTLTMHKGLASLLNKLKQGLDLLGYSAQAGVAPTPIASWLFAKARYNKHRVRACTDASLLPSRLKGLPITLFDWPATLLKNFESLGIRTLEDSVVLPRDGFLQRFGAMPLADLDKAFGYVPDPRLFYSPPETFSSGIDFGFEINDAMALLFPLRRLLSEMEGFLRGRGAGVHEWHIDIIHSKDRSRLTVGVAIPERDANRLLCLARERLAHFSLPASAIGIRVSSNRLLPFEYENKSWLNDPTQQTSSFAQLLDTLVARLGPEKVFCLSSVDDYRPEYAWMKSEPEKNRKIKAVPKAAEPRPLYLLSAPRVLLSDGEGPLCRGRLSIMTTPERLECGWWDNAAGRDYYVARNPAGETMWIYREHHGEKQWFLHGYFA